MRAPGITIANRGELAPKILHQPDSPSFPVRINNIAVIMESCAALALKAILLRGTRSGIEAATFNLHMENLMLPINYHKWNKAVLIRTMLLMTVLALTLPLNPVSAQADSLTERVEAGKPIRIGYANVAPWAFPGEDGQPIGFVNVFAVGVLHEMGITNIEPVITDWGGLIPGLKAKRFDIITGGMYIVKKRCANIAFAEPMGKFGDAFIVAKGNPKGLRTYDDIIEKGARYVTVAGYNTVEAARKEGVPERNIMTVPSPTEVLAAVRAGRADAGGLTYFSARNLVAKASADVDVTDPAFLPEYMNWVGIGFRKEDAEFLQQFNAAQTRYLGTDKMLDAVKEYGYSKEQLPGDTKTDWICRNR